MKKLAALLIALFACALWGCSQAMAESLSPLVLATPVQELLTAPEPSPTPAPTPEPMPAPTPEPTREPTTITLRIVGDIMLHEAQQVSAKTDEGYDFSEYFSKISPELSCADLTIGNLETPVANAKISGYPRFNAPPDLLDELNAAGFDAFTIANNHILDKGASGLSDTIDQLAERELLFFGASKTKQEYKVCIVEVQGIKLALLGYTYGTNGHKDSKQQVRYLTEENIKADMAAAKKQGADFIIAFPHWGREYHPGIHASTATWAKKLAEAGADLILGAHPHVVEPMEQITTKDGRTVIAVHSMGNFISNQQKDPTYAGVIIEAVLTKQPEGETALDSLGWLPTFVHRHPGKAKYRYEVLCADAPTPSGMTASNKRKLKKAAEYVASRLENDFALHLQPMDEPETEKPGD